MKLFLPALAVVAIPTAAAADRRSFTQTYEYATMPEAETEVEIWHDQSRATLDTASDRTFRFQLAIEHGISRRWDVALFQAFDQVAGAMPASDEPFGLEELRVRSRYRFAERGKWPVNVLALAEITRSFEAPIWQGEARAVLTRHFGKLAIAVNLIGDVTFGPGVDEPVIQAGWAGGLGYEVQPEIQLGVESWGGFDVDNTDAVAAYVGPAVSWAPSTALWLSTTVGFAVTDFADDLSIRGIVGLRLP